MHSKTVLVVLFFKIGSAAGRNEIGTIAILCRGPDSQAVEKHTIRAYGASRDLFALVELCRFFFKIGGAAGRNKIGTIAVLYHGPDAVGQVLEKRAVRAYGASRDLFALAESS